MPTSSEGDGLRGQISKPWRAVLAGLAAVALFAWVLRGSDLSGALGVLRGLGPLLPLALVPNLLLTLLEAGGWLFVVRGVGARAPFRGLVSVRLVADALALSLPSGPLLTEALQPYLLKRRCGLAYADGMASMIARKLYVVGSHGLCLALAVGWAYPALARASRRLLHGPLLPGLLLIAAAVLLLASLSLAAMMFRGRLGGRLWGGLRRLPLGGLRGWIERGGPSFLATDERLARFFARGPLAVLAPLPYFLLMWVVRAAENLVLLRMVGIEVGFRELMALEPSLVIVRAAFSILPAGLGVQDLGCLLFLEAMGVKDAAVVGAAYVLLRRGKELFWIAMGYLVLLIRRDDRPGTVS
jgi:hypothetical protein